MRLLLGTEMPMIALPAFSVPLPYSTTHCPATTYASRYLNGCLDVGTGWATRQIRSHAFPGKVFRVLICSILTYSERCA
jgi:hypothetical protein